MRLVTSLGNLTGDTYATEPSLRHHDSRGRSVKGTDAIQRELDGQPRGRVIGAFLPASPTAVRLGMRAMPGHPLAR